MSMPSMPEIASVTAATVVRVVSLVGMLPGLYISAVEGMKALGSGLTEGARGQVNPENLAIGLGMVAVGMVGWWVADQISRATNPHYKQIEKSRLDHLLPEIGF